MTTTRDQLIADWREHLAAAEEPQLADSQRAAWLARLRIRLYRFLLSLYGEGQWNAPRPSDAPGDSVVFDSADVLPLAGKSAKTDEQIRTKLRAFAEARDQPAEMGPLQSGLNPYSWIVVGSSSGHIRTKQLLRLLEHSGLTARISIQGDDRLVEVRAKDREKAFLIRNANEERLRGRDRIGQFDGIHFVAGITKVALFAPLLIIAIFIPISAGAEQPVTPTSIALFFGGWGACIVIYCCLATYRVAWNFLLTENLWFRVSRANSDPPAREPDSLD